jgi:two-component system, response regulator PdtaR
MTGSEPEMVSQSRQGKRIAILIVEDEALIASCITEVLQESGFAVAGVASSAPEALSLAEQTQPTLALVDIRLSGPADGVEVARALRERFAVPTIFLSGLSDEGTMARAELAQPLGFLRKPVRPSQVFNAIARALEDRG